MMEDEVKEKWDWEINPKASWKGSSIKELYAFKDLLFRMIRKELLMSFQQTLLGPFWLLVQPLITVGIYVIFSEAIGLSTDGIPSFLFYLTGITLWNLFSELFMVVSSSFAANVEVFSKVYFPRLIVPLSVLILYIIRFGFQLLLLLGVALWYCFVKEAPISLSHVWVSIPVIIVTAGIAFGGGLIFSIITVKYRDLSNLINLMIRLLMFVCPIFYTLSNIPDRAKSLVGLNPLAAPFEVFRFAFTGKGVVAEGPIIYAVLFMVIVIGAGILLFNKMGDKLMDVV